MKHTIVIDGHQREIDIRPMDEGFIVYRKMFVAPLTQENIGRVNPGDPDCLTEQFADGRFRIIEEFFRKQIRTIGSCMILAWDSEGVIGKMHFTTREMHEAIGGPEQWKSSGCYCLDHEGFAPSIKALSDAELKQLLRSESRTLRVLCFNVGHMDKRYHGQGIATAMLECLKQWSRERGWARIETLSCPDITPTAVMGGWMMRRGPLERRGFRVLEEWPAAPEQVHARLRVIEDLAGGKRNHPDRADWYVRNFPRLAANGSWSYEYDRDYLMSCDL